MQWMSHLKPINHLPFLALFFIISCGGGSSGSKEAIADPLAKYIDAEKPYKGKSTLAPINAENIGTFFTYFFFMAEELLPSYDERTSTPNSEQLCASGGNATISDTNNADEKKILFSNCNEDGLILDGNATLRITKYSSTGEALDALFVFEDTTLKAPFGDFALIGTMSDKTLDSSCPQNEVNYNFLLSNNANDQQILFDEFKVQRTGTVTLWCASAGIVTSGKIYDSNIGYWQFATTKKFRLDTMVSIFDESGTLRIDGSNGSSAQWLVNSYDVRGSSNTSYHVLLDTDGNGTFESEFNYLDDYISDELLQSFTDDDNDGIPTVWELMFGLNPNDGSDAYDDTDNDGFSNLDEFLHFGVPNDDNKLAEIADLSITLDHETKNYSSQIPITLTLKNTSSLVDTENVVITLTAQSPTKFVKRNSNCSTENDESILICTFNTMTKNSEYNLEYFLTGDKTVIGELTSHVDAKVTSRVFDPDQSNNIQTLNVSRLALDINYGVSTNDREQYTMVLTDNIKDFEFDFYIKDDRSIVNDDYVDYAYITFETSDSIEVVQGDCYGRVDNSRQWYSCLQDDEFYVDGMLNQGKINLKFQLKGLSSEHGFIRFKVKSPITGDKILKEFTLPVIVGNSSSIIQEAIDSAPENSTVSIAEGIYIGALDLSAATVHLTTEQGVEKTFLYNFDGSFLDAITIGSGSSISGFTIAKQNIEVIEGGATISNNKFDRGSYRFPNAHIRARDSLNFINNIIYSNDLPPLFERSYARDGMGCLSLLMLGKENQSFNFNVTNNLYIGNLFNNPTTDFPCDFITLYADNTATIENNTLVGLKRILSLEDAYFYKPEWVPEQSYSTNTFDLKMINNLTFKSKAFIHYLPWDDVPLNGNERKKINDNSVITLKNNLLHQVNSDFIGLENSFDEINRVTIDPLLSADWGVLKDSPAIDAGFDNGLNIDLLNNSRPIDGNNDNKADIDIGAIEYVPPN